MRRYEVEVFIDGEPTYMVDIPFSRTPESAERKARYAIMLKHRTVSIDRITAKVVE